MYIIIGAAAFFAGIAFMLFIVAGVPTASRRRPGPRLGVGERPIPRRDTPEGMEGESPETKPPTVKHRLEFSKFIVALYSFSCIAWITADYVPAFMYQQPVNTQVTVTLTTTVVVALLGYYGKSAFEKSSRNKYSLDENGVPFIYSREGS